MRTVHYGAQELKEFYQKSMAISITAASLAILVLMGSLGVYNFIVDESKKSIPVYHITPSSLLPPSSLGRTKVPAVAVVSPKVVPPKIGIPKAVPDREVPQDREFTTQEDLKRFGTLSIRNVVDGVDTGLVFDGPVEEYLPEPGAFIPVDRRPEFVKRVEPKYPQLARMSGVTGTVYVQVLVDKSGKVRDVRIYKDSGTNALLEEAAIEAAKASEFTPAISNNQPIAVWIVYRYDFKLNR